MHRRRAAGGRAGCKRDVDVGDRQSAGTLEFRKLGIGARRDLRCALAAQPEPINVATVNAPIADILMDAIGSSCEWRGLLRIFDEAAPPAACRRARSLFIARARSG